MKAPEKLYLHPNHKEEVGASWLTFPLTDTDIEYTRTDAFIEKACDWLFNQANYYAKLKIDAHSGSVYADFYADKMVEDFKNYMKRE